MSGSIPEKITGGDHDREGLLPLLDGNILSPDAADTDSLQRALAMALGAVQVDAAVTLMGEGNRPGGSPTP